MRRDMDSSISSLCGDLSDVLSHADSSSRALSAALTRRPIPLGPGPGAPRDHGLRHRLRRGAPRPLPRGAVESRLVSFGYVAPAVDEEEEDGDTGELGIPTNGSSSALKSGWERFEDDADALFEDSMSLKNLGISDVCLATLSSQGKDFSASPKMPDRKPESESVDDGQEIIKEAEEPTPPQIETVGQDDDAFQGMINASKEQYEKLPPYLRTLASWEELCDAVSKLNSYYGGDEGQGSVALNQDDVGSIGLGRKGRSYLLILLRLNQLAMETIDGSIFYTLRKNAS